MNLQRETRPSCESKMSCVGNHLKAAQERRNEIAPVEKMYWWFEEGEILIIEFFVSRIQDLSEQKEKEQEYFVICVFERNANIMRTPDTRSSLLYTLICLRRPSDKEHVRSPER